MLGLFVSQALAGSSTYTKNGYGLENYRLYPNEVLTVDIPSGASVFVLSSLDLHKILTATVSKGPMVKTIPIASATEVISSLHIFGDSVDLQSTKSYGVVDLQVWTIPDGICSKSNVFIKAPNTFEYSYNPVYADKVCVFYPNRESSFYTYTDAAHVGSYGTDYKIYVNSTSSYYTPDSSWPSSSLTTTLYIVKPSFVYQSNIASPSDTHLTFTPARTSTDYIGKCAENYFSAVDVFGLHVKSEAVYVLSHSLSCRSSSGGGGDIDVGTIIGVVIGGFVAIVFILVCVCIFCPCGFCGCMYGQCLGSCLGSCFGTCCSQCRQSTQVSTPNVNVEIHTPLNTGSQGYAPYQPPAPAPYPQAPVYPQGQPQYGYVA